MRSDSDDSSQFTPKNLVRGLLKDFLKLGRSNPFFAIIQSYFRGNPPKLGAWKALHLVFASNLLTA
jgi:hypothetical protein